ncbi:hypothetical protein TNCV_549511 [Trichonephila clavipes]|nr:hypothetical protein TNCV_549511 [Trichonephila clavipes]
MKPYYDPDLQAHFNDSVASDDRRFGECTASTGRNDSFGPTSRSRSKLEKQFETLQSPKATMFPILRSCAAFPVPQSPSVFPR